MANINLISAYRAERVRLTRLARALLVMELLCVAVIAVSFLFLGGRVLVTHGHVRRSRAELAKLRPSIQRIEDIEDQRFALTPRLALLSDAQVSTRRWLGILESLKRCVPADTWLTNITVESNQETGKRLKVSGVTISQSHVGETMLRLSQVREYYERVDLSFTRPLLVNDVRRVEFEIVAPLVMPELPGGSNDES